jgi:hypothetical protein
MSRHGFRGFGLVAVLAILFATGSAFAQTAKDLVGTWSLVSADIFGTNPTGILMLDANGHISATLMKSNIPKYAANNRGQGTAEENKATVQGMIVWFGTYSLQGSDLLIHIEGSSFPNWIGVDQKRTNISVAGDELRWTQPAPSIGGPSNLTVWKRAK